MKLKLILSMLAGLCTTYVAAVDITTHKDVALLDQIIFHLESEKESCEKYELTIGLPVTFAVLVCAFCCICLICCNGEIKKIIKKTTFCCRTSDPDAEA